MKQITNKTYKKWLFVFLKLIILFAAIGFVYQRIVTEENAFKTLLQTKVNWFWLICIIALLPVNWSIEAEKWRFAVSKLQKLTFAKALRGTLIGLVFAIFTPNRIGELGGRVLVLRKRFRFAGVYATTICSISQTLTISMFGVFAALLLFACFPQVISTHFVELSSFVMFFLIFVNLLFIAFYMKVNRLTRFIKSRKILTQYAKYMDYLSEFSDKELLTLLFYNSLRYLVFSVQFCFMLFFFQIEISFIEAWIVAGLIYLSVTFVPTFALAEVGVRGSVALFFVGFWSDKSATIVAAMTFLWLINVALPTSLGAILLSKHKI